MFLFGHVGLTLGTAALLSGALKRSYSRKGQDKADDYPESGTGDVSAPVRVSSSWLTSLAGRIDIRLLLLASLLPDIIDKPAGLFFFRDIFSNSRLFGHTLLLAVVIFLTGLYLYRSRGRFWLLVLAFGAFAHLIFDQMWHTPQTLFWPLYGFAFKEVDMTGWGSRLLNSLFTDPWIFIPELAGIAILIWFTWLTVRRGTLLAFLGKGKIR